jgi:hypothetical protein
LLDLRRFAAAALAAAPGRASLRQDRATLRSPALSGGLIRHRRRRIRRLAHRDWEHAVRFHGPGGASENKDRAAGQQTADAGASLTFALLMSGLFGRHGSLFMLLMLRC